jgi:thioredoxin reductase (NADPH)
MPRVNIHDSRQDRARQGDPSREERDGSLAANMSELLDQVLEAADNVEDRLNTRFVDGGGRGRLERLVLEDSVSNTTETVRSAALFVLIGARPFTSRLTENVRRDEGGYVVSWPDLLRGGWSPEGWSLGRPPLPMETSIPGVFAAGDVSYGSVKRVASAVGAGAITV